MATNTYQVGTTALRPEFRGYMGGSYPTPVSVINTGAVTVYLDDEPQTDVSRGRPLGPGSTVVWEANSPLWLVAESAEGEVRISDSAGAMFDAGQVATQLLAQGLPEAIAQQVYIAGAPPVDKPKALYSATLNQNGTTTQSAAFDVSSFGSVAWRFRGLDPATVASPPGITLIGVYWFDTSLSTVLAADYLNLIGDNNRFSFFEFSSGRMAVKGPYVVFVVTTLNRPGGSVQFSAQGSIRQVRNSSWLMNGYYTTGGGICTSYGLDRFVSVLSPNLASTASIGEWFPTKSGLCTALFSYNATVPANGLDFLVHDMNGTPVAGVRAAGAGLSSYTLQQQFYMPDRPVQIFLRNKGPAALTTAMSAAFTWESE